MTMTPSKEHPVLILHGDARQALKDIPDNSVQCCISSPPYWGLRVYCATDDPMKQFEIGNEATPELYIQNIVAVYREVWRVLRPDGCIFVNLGDCYHSGQKEGNQRPCGDKQATNRGTIKGLSPNRNAQAGLKPKDLVGIPWMVAFALRADGWYLRCDIIWEKSNPMPESVLDRFTKSHEYIFLLAKSKNYYFDAEAVKEPVSGTANARGSGVNPKAAGANSKAFKDKDAAHIGKNEESQDRHKHGFNHRWKVKQNPSFSAAVSGLVSMRNKRSVWKFASEAYKGCHFATFPTALVEPCLFAGTSAKGCCGACGAPYERILEKAKVVYGDYDGKYAGEDNRGRNLQRALKAAREATGEHDDCWPQAKTIGWQATCKCENAEIVPCTVLDVFAGSGTTLAVAREHGRWCIGVELNKESLPLIDERLNKVTPGLGLA